MDPIRHYCVEETDAQNSVAHIIELIATGAVEPRIGLDVETMPIEGLEGRPHREADPEGKTKWPTKVEQREYWIALTDRLFHPDALADLGVFIPKKKQKKKDAQAGIPAAFAVSGYYNAAWKLLRERVNALYLGDLQSHMRVQNRDLLKLWVHFLNVAEDAKRITTDPVDPGLDPYTTDIFTVQITVRHPSGQLESWIFNCAQHPIEVLRPLMDLPKVTYLGANIKFDLKHLYHNLGIAPFNVFCTQVADRMLHLGLQNVRHSLGACAKRYCGVTLDKSVRASFIGVRSKELTPEQLEYAYEDSEILFSLYDKMTEIAAKRGQERLLQTFCLLSLPVALWEYEGYNVNQTKWLEIYGKVVKERDEVAAEVEKLLLPPGYAEIFGLEANSEENEPESGENEDEEGQDTRPNAIIRLSQRALVAERLSDVLEIQVKSLGKIERETLDQAYREKTGGDIHPFFELYDRWSKLSKQASTYGATFLWAVHPLTGRVHPRFNIAGTDTGRFSCVKPNMLNIPTVKNEGDVDFRAAFLPPPGYVFGNADYNNMEQRIAADITQDPTLCALFASGGDAHKVTAAMMFHLRRAKVAAPRVVSDKFKYGIVSYDIQVLEVPEALTNAEMFAYAVSEQVQSFVTKKTRQVAKSVAFLFFFGGGPYTLALRQHILLALAEDFFARYTGTYPVLAQRFEELGMLPLTTNVFRDENGIEYGYAEAYGGLRRYFELPHNPSRREFSNDYQGLIAFELAQKEFRKRRGSISREGKNVPTQGGNAVIIAEAIIELWQRGKGLGLRPVLSIYDEFLVLVPETLSPERANRIIEQCMVAPAGKYFQTVECVADANPVSPYWAKF